MKWSKRWPRYSTPVLTVALWNDFRLLCFKECQECFWLHKIGVNMSRQRLFINTKKDTTQTLVWIITVNDHSIIRSYSSTDELRLHPQNSPESRAERGSGRVMTCGEVWSGAVLSGDLRPCGAVCAAPWRGAGPWWRPPPWRAAPGPQSSAGPGAGGSHSGRAATQARGLDRYQEVKHLNTHTHTYVRIDNTSIKTVSVQHVVESDYVVKVWMRGLNENRVGCIWYWTTWSGLRSCVWALLCSLQSFKRLGPGSARTVYALVDVWLNSRAETHSGKHCCHRVHCEI